MSCPHFGNRAAEEVDRTGLETVCQRDCTAMTGKRPPTSRTSVPCLAGLQGRGHSSVSGRLRKTGPGANSGSNLSGKLDWTREGEGQMAPRLLKSQSTGPRTTTTRAHSMRSPPRLSAVSVFPKPSQLGSLIPELHSATAMDSAVHGTEPGGTESTIRIRVLGLGSPLS